MGKQILLIGVSAGELAAEHPGPSPAIANVTALKQTLLSAIAGLRDDQVVTLINPKLRQLRHEIVRMNYRCRRGDLCLIYYTGCGVIEADSGMIYLPAKDTQLDRLTDTSISGDFIRRALPAMRDGLDRVMVLDCLWGAVPSQQPIETDNFETASLSTDGFESGSFESGSFTPSPPQNGAANGRSLTQSLPHLADCNCALLTALGSVARPWPMTDLGLSLYTHSLIKGITTGLADLDADGHISVGDLQAYLSQSLAEANVESLPIALYAPSDSPQITLMPAPAYSPEREYRRSIEEYVQRYQGHIPPASRDILEFLRRQLGITIDQSQAIEADVLQPFDDREEICDRYRDAFQSAIQLEFPLDTPLKKWLRHLQHQLALSYEDVCAIEAQVLAQDRPYENFPASPQWIQPADAQTLLKLPAHALGSDPTVHGNSHSPENGYANRNY
ncbi:MAG: hypothetical protein AAGF01_16160 [Cyanobacteria bacterium P01_G01_bin.38]